MKQVVDSNGNNIGGLFRRDDGSLVVTDITALNRNKISHEVFAALNNEVKVLREQMDQILKVMKWQS